MRLLRTSEPQPVVVKTYGRDSLLALLNPLMTLLVRSLGLEVRLRSDAEVMAMMEKDGIAMTMKGYRIASADEFTIPAFGARYMKVTYELVDRPR